MTSENIHEDMLVENYRRCIGRAFLANVLNGNCVLFKDYNQPLPMNVLLNNSEYEYITPLNNTILTLLHGGENTGNWVMIPSLKDVQKLNISQPPIPIHIVAKHVIVDIFYGSSTPSEDGGHEEDGSYTAYPQVFKVKDLNSMGFQVSQQKDPLNLSKEYPDFYRDVGLYFYLYNTSCLGDVNLEIPTRTASEPGLAAGLRKIISAVNKGASQDDPFSLCHEYLEQTLFAERNYEEFSKELNVQAPVSKEIGIQLYKKIVLLHWSMMYSMNYKGLSFEKTDVQFLSELGTVNPEYFYYLFRHCINSSLE